jgi:phosphoglycerate dehydrogenase-like enzyme
VENKAMPEPLNILIASYLEPHFVEEIQAAVPEHRVVYAPELLGQPRYVADHTAPVVRTPAEEARWRNLLAQADILFDYDHSNLDNLQALAPRVRWIQATSAGIGQMVKRIGLLESDILLTTASGVHRTALAEFCLMAMLMFAKRAFHLADAKARKHWARICTDQLAGQTVAVIGLGRVGTQIAQLARAVGMRVIGTKRTLAGVQPADLGVDALYAPTALAEVLPQADFVVLITPHTDTTELLIGGPQLAQMKRSGVLINIARGVVVDEAALIAALQGGTIAGAALDVFATEPLPPDSPLWDLPNVLISPHSASTTANENAKLTALFIDNLQRFLAGQPLRNVLDRELLY